MTQRLKSLNPLKLLSDGSGFLYQRLPPDSDSPRASSSNSPFSLQPLKGYRWPSPRRDRIFPARFSPTRAVWVLFTALLCAGLLIGGYEHRRASRTGDRKDADSKPELHHWQYFQRLHGYYNGIRTLVLYRDYTPENGYNKTMPATLFTPSDTNQLDKMPPLKPVRYDPYPKFDSIEFLEHNYPVTACSLDTAGKIPLPDVYAYPGVPQNMSQPFFGSYDLLGLPESVCFDRYGRFAAYGYGVPLDKGGLGPGNKSENTGSELISEQTGIVDYKNIDWGTLQDNCYEKNRLRFVSSSKFKERVKRHAYVLRIWQGFYFNEHQMYSLRAMINELSLKSGGEYDVHFLLHVQNTSIPVWADPGVYDQFIRDNMPEEFWNMTTLWSELQMSNYYPGPLEPTFANMAGSDIHGVYRSAHFPLQWFAQQQPDYDFYWNWEMDVRYTGHYYEFNTRIGDFARAQPRKGLWERNERFYIPKRHGTWEQFIEMVEGETQKAKISPIWGPVTFNNTGALPTPTDNLPPTIYADDHFDWGVGEDADYISLNPIFDPSKTNWVFRDDITGYSMDMDKPPRRCAIVTIARLSKKLLDIMHKETWMMKHTMFPEMWPPTVAMHHGLKAVYVPHPIYFENDWDLDHMDQVFNHPKEVWESPFGWGEHNLGGASFYYNSGFSGALWRRWLGQREGGQGGRKAEEEGTGRMCLRSSLHHPVKQELGNMD